MKRREFITAFSGAVIVWPLAARAQQSAIPLIGFLGSASPDLWVDRLLVFRESLREAGFVENRNVAIEYRWADGQYDRLPALNETAHAVACGNDPNASSVETWESEG
jgi:putative tryptophan/tyrosine transport system substrate-binding protein